MPEADNAWSIGPRTVPPPIGASPQLRDLLAQSSAPEPPATTPATPDEVKAEGRTAGGATAEQAVAFAGKAGIDIARDVIGGVPVTRLTPSEVAPEHAGQLFVHIHGGGFVTGAGLAGIAEAVRIAAFLKMPVLSIDYRMPPDHPAPAPMDDVIAVWRELVEAHSPDCIALGGTSVGGTLTLAATLRMKALGLPLPAALFLGTPVADLAKRGDMRFINDGIDHTLVNWTTVAYPIGLYVGSSSYDDPYISPIFGDFAGFPPAHLVSGTRDLMLSDAVRVHRKLRQAGVDADLHVFEGFAHADYLRLDGTPEQREHFAELNAFVLRHLTPGADRAWSH